MDITIFILLFVVLEVVTPLVVQGIKVTLEGLNRTYNATLLALITAVLLSIGVSIFYMLANNITFSALSVIYIIALIMANWLGSTLGYDKIKAAIQVIDKTKE